MKYRGYLLAFLSAALYGSIGIFVKNGISEKFGPIDLIMLQMLLSIFVLFVIFAFKSKKELKLSIKQFKRLFILGGLSNTAILVFNYQSYKYLSIAVATVILYTYPALVAIASAVIFKVRVTSNKVIAIIGTFIGCLLIINITSPSVLASLNGVGLVYAFLAAIAFAFFNLYAAKILNDTKPLVVAFYNSIFTFAVLLVFNFGFIYKLQYIKKDLLMNTSILAIFCGIIPSLLFYVALKDIGSIPVSIIGSLEIPIAGILACLVFGDTLSSIQIIGILISLASVILLRFEPKEKAYNNE
jgi:drug/metabolite transporter (DMT)-like permease